MTPARLAVLATGARTALGADLAGSAAAARAGVCQFAAHPYMVDACGFPMMVARDPFLEPGADRTSRMAQLAVSAALDCLDRASVERPGRPAILLTLALPDAQAAPAGFDAEPLVHQVCGRLQQHADVAGVQYHCLGHAGGAQALGACAEVLAQRGDLLALVLGVDSWLDVETLEWLDDEELLRTDRRPFGFLPGEAAAAVLLGAVEGSGSAGMIVEGCALATEPESPPHQPRLGLALTQAARAAWAACSGRVAFAEALYADLNGQSARADEVGYTTVRMRDRLAPAHALHVPAECFGDVGAATVPLMVALAGERARAARGDEASALLLSQSARGARAAVVLSLHAKELNHGRHRSH